MIAKSKSHTKGRCVRHLTGISLLVVGLCLGGCTSSMDLFGSAPKVDRTLTGTIPNKPQPSSETVSDEATVRNAVTSADLSKTTTHSVPWANTATGSAGVVSSIREDRNQGYLCRAFTTTRHSFEGIAMFSGQACQTGSGDWMLTAFDRQ